MYLIPILISTLNTIDVNVEYITNIIQLNSITTHTKYILQINRMYIFQIQLAKEHKKIMYIHPNLNLFTNTIEDILYKQFDDKMLLIMCDFNTSHYSPLYDALHNQLIIKYI